MGPLLGLPHNTMQAAVTINKIYELVPGYGPDRTVSNTKFSSIIRNELEMKARERIL